MRGAQAADATEEDADELGHDEESRYLQLLEGGLEVLQRLDMITARLLGANELVRRRRARRRLRRAAAARRHSDVGRAAETVRACEDEGAGGRTSRRCGCYSRCGGVRVVGVCSGACVCVCVCLRRPHARRHRCCCWCCCEEFGAHVGEEEEGLTEADAARRAELAVLAAGVEAAVAAPALSEQADAVAAPESGAAAADAL